MAVEHPLWKKVLCYVTCEWFSKPVFGKRVCTCIYDVLGVKRKVKREQNGKDGGFRFFRAPKTIAFIGLDGSGKSTQAKEVIKLLTEYGFKTSYLHMPSSVPVSLVAKTIKTLSLSKKNKGIKKQNIIKSSLRQILFLLGIPWIYISKIIPNFFRARVIVSDRWFYDELVHLEYRKMCFFPKLYNFLIPSPKLLIYLKVDSKTASKRKKEHNIEYFITKKRLYEELIKKLKVEKIKSFKLDKTKKDVERLLNKRLKYAFD